MTTGPASPKPRPPGRPRKPPAGSERSLLATTIRHVDDDGNVARLTLVELQSLIKQERNDHARMERERRAEVLRMVCEDRAAMASFLAEEREAERAIAKFWAKMRVRVREPRKQPDREGRRFTREIYRSRPRRLPTYSKDIIDAFGRRGIYYRARYVSGRKGASYVGCAKAVWRYFIREDAFEHDAAGVPSVISNMGTDALEVGAACDLLESVQRAERANAKLFTVIEANLPHDLSPEARVTALYRFCEEAFGAFDLPYAAAVHHPPEGGDQRNTHAHIMVWWRPAIRVAPYEWQVAKDLATEQDSTEMTMVQREQFAEAMTWASQAEGRRRVYTGLSHAQRGLAIKPTVRIGKDLTELHRRGERIALIERNASTIKSNEAILDADRVRTGLAAIETIGRELDALERLRSAAVADAGLSTTPAARSARGIDPTMTVPPPAKAALLRPTPSLSTPPPRATVFLRGDIPARPAPQRASTVITIGSLSAPRRAAPITPSPPDVSREPKRAGWSARLDPSPNRSSDSGKARRRRSQTAVLRPAIGEPLAVDGARRRCLLAMARLQASLDEQRRADEAEPEWDPRLGVPGALPDRLPTLSSRGTHNADGSMTIDGLSVMLADLPTSAKGSGPAVSARGVSVPIGAHDRRSAMPALPLLGNAVALRVAVADPVSRGPAMPPPSARWVAGTAIARVAAKAGEIVRGPALPPLRHARKITVAASQPLPNEAGMIQNLPVAGVTPPVARATSRMPGPAHAPALSRAKAVVGIPLALVARRADLVMVSRLFLSAPRARARQVRSLPPSATTITAAEPIDQLHDVLSFLARLRRERQARERGRRDDKAVQNAPAAAAGPSSANPNAEPVVRFETHDPADPERLSATLLDHLADVALHPEWLQVEGRRIHHVGGSTSFNERWRAWRGNQEVLRLIIKVHRRATGGSDDLPPAIRTQVDAAVARRNVPVACAEPSQFPQIPPAGNER